jgi:hypothetical protein
MTTQVPARSLVDHRITATVKAFLAGRGLRVTDVAPQVGISQTTFYAKLKGVSPWTAAEVAALANLFGVGVNDLYSGLNGTFAQATGTWTEQEGTWADRANPETANRPISSGWRTSRRLRLVETSTLSALDAAA